MSRNYYSEINLYIVWHTKNSSTLLTSIVELIASAHDANEQVGKRQKVLQWQAGYGVVSFGTKDLEWVVEYIRNQREHHSRADAHDRLERITNDDA